MPRYIIKLTDVVTGTDHYMEWSTIVDAPVTYGMSLDEFTEYYRAEYGEHEMLDFAGRMTRVQKKGVSAHDYSDANELIMGNRAGPNECPLTKQEIINAYCRRQPTAISCLWYMGKDGWWRHFDEDVYLEDEAGR